MTIKIRVTEFQFTPDYFTKLLGCIHKWIGRDNDVHGQMALYSYSHIWKDHFYFSSYVPEICSRLMTGISKDAQMWDNVKVDKVELFMYDSTNRTYRTTSPIFAKEENKHLFDKEAEIICKRILIKKANLVGIDLGDFEISLKNRREKLIKIHSINNKCAMYEVNISTIKAAKFAERVGLGSCTGTGFGHIILNDSFINK